MSGKKSKNLATTRGKVPKASRKNKEGMTALMIEFCGEYALNGYTNATAAYIRARGYEGSYAGASVAASKMSRHPLVKGRLARMRRKAETIPFAVSLEEIQRDLYDAVQVTMGRKAAPRIDRDKNGITGAVNLQNFEGMAAISALDKLAKMQGAYEKGQAASGLKVNINIDIGGQTAGPHPTVSTVLASDKTDDKADPVVSEQ